MSNQTAAAPAKKKKGGLGKKLREVFSELKKVTWPTMKETMKQLGIVIAVVLFFLIIITAADFGLGKLLSLIVGLAK